MHLKNRPTVNILSLHTSLALPAPYPALLQTVCSGLLSLPPFSLSTTLPCLVLLCSISTTLPAQHPCPAPLPYLYYPACPALLP